MAIYYEHLQWFPRDFLDYQTFVHWFIDHTINTLLLMREKKCPGKKYPKY